MKSWCCAVLQGEKLHRCWLWFPVSTRKEWWSRPGRGRRPQLSPTSSWYLHYWMFSCARLCPKFFVHVTFFYLHRSPLRLVVITLILHMRKPGLAPKSQILVAEQNSMSLDVHWPPQPMLSTRCSPECNPGIQPGPSFIISSYLPWSRIA